MGVERDPDTDMPTSGLQRIGKGPWFNANGALVASSVDELYGLNGNAELFLDERGEKINGQWEGSPTPNEN